MNYHKASIKILHFLIPAIGMAVMAEANTFEPSTSPVFSTPQAKPNIHMLFDDSASMKAKDTVMPEHAYSFGSPVCKRQSTAWHNERKRLGEYDPFSKARYIPWDDSIAKNGLIDGKKKPPRIMECADVTRTEALDYAFKSVMYKYRDKAYLGVSFLWQVNDDGSKNKGNGLIRLPIDDYSGLSDQKFKSTAIDPVSKLIKNSPGNTPMYPAVYEAIKMFRGQPVTAFGVNERFTQFPVVKKECKGSSCFYAYVQHPTPLRYRCQQNHLIVMTDGQPNDYKVWGIGKNDGMSTSSTSVKDLYVNDVNQSVTGTTTGKKMGELTSKVDLRSVHKPILKNGQWVEKDKDDAGKAWNDALSIPMPIFTHSVSLFVDPKSSIYTDMTQPTKGMNLGFAKGDGNAEDLMLAFDTIFSSIIRSTSSTLATNDRNNADVLDGRPAISGGNIDLSTVGTIRYDTTYNFRQRIGNVRAVVPYISEYKEIAGSKKKEAVVSTLELWNTNTTIKSNQGRYLTFIDAGKGNNGTKFTYLTDANVNKQFSSIFDATNYGVKFDKSYIDWLVDFEKTTHPNQLRGRLQPMGSITNSDLALVNKDALNINVVKEKMSRNLSKELVGYLKYKAKYQPTNLLIVTDNDGFINFINAQRGLTGNEKAGARNTAYFPQLLAHRLDEIAKDNREATLVMEGKTNLTDAKVYQQTVGDIYATIGLTAMGSGGKGLVGYRVYAASQDSVDRSVAPSNNVADTIDKVLPLFEITNQGPEQYRTKGFENLGYTYSGFEFFNRLVDQGSNKRGQSVAIFGNGFGVDQSVLYFIDAYTGEKLQEIILSKNGGGASTPSIIVRNDPANNGQVLDRIYVGDYSGTLYKIDFNGQDFTDQNAVKVTALFKASTSPNNLGQSAISVKPLVIKNKSSGLYNISFGTGIAASKELDRGKNSLVEHSIYNIIDHNRTSIDSTATVAELAKNGVALKPLLSQNQLKVGKVSYQDGANIDYLSQNKYQLDIETPKASGSESNVNQYGWSMKLLADGSTSGERVIQNPKYDARTDAVVFATWGIHERDLSYSVGNVYDPCLADAAFGKLLSFNVKTGGSSGKKGIMNQGLTNTAPGGITGDDIVSDPEGNSTTDLSQLENDLQDEIIEIVGKDDSAYTTDPDNLGYECSGDILGQLDCDGKERDKVELHKGRISIQKIF